MSHIDLRRNRPISDICPAAKTPHHIVAMDRRSPDTVRCIARAVAGLSGWPPAITDARLPTQKFEQTVAKPVLWHVRPVSGSIQVGSRRVEA
jgi:hypothetical protein